MYIHHLFLIIFLIYVVISYIFYILIISSKKRYFVTFWISSKLIKNLSVLKVLHL